MVMKIRSDYVTNSSSTSFILITAGGFHRNEFLDLMGVAPDSPWLQFFEALYEALQRKMYPAADYVARYHDAHEPWLETLSELFSNKIIARMKMAPDEGKEVFIGKLSSDDGDPFEAFFAVDSFEIEDDKIYFNALECTW
jgi:hypothetical protein